MSKEKYPLIGNRSHNYEWAAKMKTEDFVADRVKHYRKIKAYPRMNDDQLKEMLTSDHKIIMTAMGKETQAQAVKGKQ